MISRLLLRSLLIAAAFCLPGMGSVAFAKDAQVPDAKTNSNGQIIADNARLIEGDHCVSMTLTNTGTMIDALVLAKTAIAKEVVLIDQRMHRDVPKIELLPKTPLAIEPGRACIVLRNIPTPPKAGDTFTLALTFEHAASITTTVRVVAADQPAAPSKPETAKTPQKSEVVK